MKQVMIENMETEMENVQEHLDSVNAKMKKVLLESGRSTDKLCMDVVCIIILLTLVGIIYTMLK